MRKHAFNYLIIAVSIILSACNGRISEVPTGRWSSKSGHPDITIVKVNGKDNDKYEAIIYHKTYDGRICPVKYPLIISACGMYIQAEGRVLVSYSCSDDRLFLSPGGKYHRQGNNSSDK